MSSPFSTGGGGSDYERRVGACYLAMALLRAVPRGLDAGLAREIRFQQLYAGDPLDDVVVMSDLPSGQAKLALQIKHDLAFRRSDGNLEAVVGAAWETFRSPRFSPNVDRLGVVVGLYSKTVDEHHQAVLTWARTSATAADFLERVGQPGLSSAGKRDFVALMREELAKCKGEAVTDDELWMFLRSVVILHFDVLVDGSRDQSYVVESLRHVLPAERQAEAGRLFSQLVEYAAEGFRSAGSFTPEMLRERLQADGFELLPAADCRRDLERLKEHAGFVLADIRADIGGLVLNRADLVAQAHEQVRSGGLVALVGPPGVGKSAILRSLVEQQQGEGHVIVLSGMRIEGPGWNGFARDLHLERPLRDILLASSTGASPCVFIDGIDRVPTESGRATINDLLRATAEWPKRQDGTPRWTVVVSAREENLQALHGWLDYRAFGAPRTLPVPDLSDEDLALVAQHSPRLERLLLLDELRPVLRNAFLLSLLENERMLPGARALPDIATELEVSSVWWERFVGSDAEGRARQHALLELGRQALRSPGRPLPPANIPADVLVSFESDRILLHDDTRDVYRFSHDVLEDWVFYRVLRQHQEAFPAFIREIGQPIGLLRAVQMVGAALLEQHERADEWVRTLRGFESAPDLAPRWRQALLTAPLISTRARDLLDRAEPFLLEDNGRLLSELLLTVRTAHVLPDFRLLPAAERVATRRDGVLSALLANPVPVWRVWFALLGWLLPRANAVPEDVRADVAELMRVWQRSAPQLPFRHQIAMQAFAWLAEIERERYGEEA